MIPILFAATATNFQTNGIGRLADAISCVVSEERNGEYEMRMEYPITGAHYSDIGNSKIIVVKASQTAGLQAFRIYKISKPISGRVTVLCRHISYQLAYIPFKAFSATSLAGALAGFKSMALEPCPFTLTADFTSTSSFAVPLPASIRSYLGGREGSIIDVYGGGAEWEWDNYNCILHAHRGSDKGVVLRYGKNITDVEQEENIENTITGIMPYWKAEDSVVTLAAPVESSTAGNFPFPRTVVKDFSDQWDNAPTQAQLTAYTQSYIRANNIGIPAISINVSFVNLPDTVEYKDIAPLETVSLCDTITVEFAKLGISAKAKVVKTEYDVLRERYDRLTVGDARATLSSTIEDQMTAINQRPTIDQTRTDIDRATGVLNAGLRGHVIINRNDEGWANEILFLDNANVALAKNVLRINTNGIGFSTTGYQGPYYQSWTIDGHLALGGVNNAYGDFEILDGSGNRLGEWDKDGLRLYDNSQKLLMRLNHGGLYLYNAAGKTLAQLTTAGLNVYEGSIEGGRIKIGSKFEVKTDGTMTATGATFTGEIKGGKITIGKNFSVDDKGNMKATNAQFTGNITGSVIEGSTIRAKGGEFVASEESVYIGGLYTYHTDSGNYLAGNDESFGIGDNEDYHLWTGWDGNDPDIDDPQDILGCYGCVITSQNMYAQEIYLSDSIFDGRTHWWGVGETIADIYDALDDLANASGGE